MCPSPRDLQNVEVIDAEGFSAWMDRNGLSLSTAADALGMTRRMMAHYRTGSRAIPRVVALACKGWEAERRHD